MAIASTSTVDRFVLYDVPWSTYESILAGNGDRPIRLTYDRGVLEMMSPLQEHERAKKLLGRMIETLTVELRIPIRSAGSTTLRSELKQRGLEPDECYYVVNEARVRGKARFDLSIDPPPDLAIEVDITSSSLDRMGIYAALGVLEVWRYDGEGLSVQMLQADGSYARQPQSTAFPFLPIDELRKFLDRCDETDETSWICSFGDWVRTMPWSSKKGKS